MNDVLRDAIAGEPVMVTLGGQAYPLAFPMQAVILYKQVTAALDRERNKASGRKALSRDEKRDLREKRRTLLAEAAQERPAKGEAWDDARYARFEELLADSIAVKATLDEDAALGDSLYDKSNWWKISPEGDPERLLLALWVGLHKFEISPRVKYVEALSREALGTLVNLGNGQELTVAIAKALRGHMIAPAEDDAEDESPNVPTAPETAPAATEIPQPDNVTVIISGTTAAK